MSSIQPIGVQQTKSFDISDKISSQDMAMVGGGLAAGALAGAGTSYLTKISEDEFVNAGKRGLAKFLSDGQSDAAKNFWKACLLDDKSSFKKYLKAVDENDFLKGVPVADAFANFKDSTEGLSSIVDNSLKTLYNKKSLGEGMFSFEEKDLDDAVSSVVDGVRKIISKVNPESVDIDKLLATNSVIDEVSKIRTVLAEYAPAIHSMGSFLSDVADDKNVMDECNGILKGLSENINPATEETLETSIKNLSDREVLEYILKPERVKAFSEFTERVKDMAPQEIKIALFNDILENKNITSHIEDFTNNTFKLARLRKAGKFAAIGAGIAGIAAAGYAFVFGDKKEV